jgi:hypothetical protein
MEAFLGKKNNLPKCTELEMEKRNSFITTKGNELVPSNISTSETLGLYSFISNL